jgi:isoaspartyl peptidase/L-asparaginase-like protein (Ntn-hydrolase superfamily)
VLKNTKHTLLVGDKATEFAISLGNFTICFGIKPVMRVARKVLEYTKHTLLVGDKATEFAIS